MPKFSTIILLGLLPVFGGCQSGQGISGNYDALAWKDAQNAKQHLNAYETVDYDALGWKDAHDAKQHLDAYESVVVACITYCQFTEPSPLLWPDPERSYWCAATIIKSYKGEWTVPEQIQFRFNVKKGEPAVPSSGPIWNYEALGMLVYMFLPERNGTEIVMKRSDWGVYNAETEKALESLYPGMKTRWRSTDNLKMEKTPQ